MWRSTVLKIVLETIILERERSQGSSFFALTRSGSEQSFRIKFAMKFLKWNENCLSHSYSGRSELVLYFVMYISPHLLRRHCIVYLLIVDVYTRQWNTCMVVGRILPANNHLFHIVKCFYSRRSRPIVYLTVILSMTLLTLSYYMRNFFNLIGLEQLYFSLIWNTCMWKLQTFWG